MEQPSYARETQAVQRIAGDPACRFRWTKHALERMVERGITAEDVKCALINGQVVLHELKRDLLWRVDGKDLDGGRLQVEAAVYEEEILIKVITAF